jgi:hypothetical protein
MRHLYVLAVEHRGVDAVDVETRESVFMPLEIRMKDGRREGRIAPCLLPELDLIEEVVTRSPRYYPLSFRLAGEEGGGRREGGRKGGGPRLFEGVRRRILVKRKPGRWRGREGGREGGRVGGRMGG